MRVLVFGDSIAQSFWDVEGGWVARLRKHYDLKQIADLKRDGPVIFNLGISANTIRNVIDRFTAETEARKRHGDLAFIFAIGINDTLLHDGKPTSNSEKYDDELHELVALAEKYSNRILFVGMTPVDETKTTPVGWGNWVYRNARILEFESMLKQFCHDHQWPLVEVYDHFLAEHKKHNLLPDGLHPNDAGHNLIADLVRPELEKLLN